MRRWALLGIIPALLVLIGATAWAQVEPGTSTTVMPPTTIPTSTSSSPTSVITTTSGASTSTVCAIGTTTTYCYPIPTDTTATTAPPPPTTQPASCDCQDRQVTTSNPARYADRAQQGRASGLTCFNIRLTDSGQFIVSASGDAGSLTWLFPSG